MLVFATITLCTAGEDAGEAADSHPLVRSTPPPLPLLSDPDGEGAAAEAAKAAAGGRRRYLETSAIAYLLRKGEDSPTDTGVQHARRVVTAIGLDSRRGAASTSAAAAAIRRGMRAGRLPMAAVSAGAHGVLDRRYPGSADAAKHAGLELPPAAA